MNTKQLSSAISVGYIDNTLVSLYGREALKEQRRRYLSAVAAFEAKYGERDGAIILSVSGRSELSGNHTDHNRGRVIAASVNLDIVAVAAPLAGSEIRLTSEGFGEDVLDFKSYNAPDESRFGTSASIIAGMCHGFRKEGYAVGGFCAYTTSNVLKGSGLSSSAAFENTVGTILNHLYNEGSVDNVKIAMLSQKAENEFFGKPCGLMDQVACAAGGVVAIDFEDPTAPKIDFLKVNMPDHRLCIVDTGGNHADLTGDYAAVPAEMKAIAAHFGKSCLREVTREQVVEEIPALRRRFGDRSILRALHFFAENVRVGEQTEALQARDLARFFEGVKASGRSSFCYLQNVYTTKNVEEQGLSLALCLAEGFLADKLGAWRVHGGGFAGTIQCYVPVDSVEDFRALMDGAFGEGACIVLRIRAEGAMRVL